MRSDGWGGWNGWKSDEIETEVVTENEFHRRRERFTDETRTSRGTSVPGVEDVFGKLKEYLIDLERNHFYTELNEVKGLQNRTTSAEFGAFAFDHLSDLESIPIRIEFLNSLAKRNRAKNRVSVSVYTTSSVDLFGVRSELLPWMQYHTELGVNQFYLLYDGTDPTAVEYLSRIHHLSLIHIHPPFASDNDLVDFATWTQAHKQWGGKPGNFELMVKQGYGITKCLQLAKRKGDDWLLHIDPDELFYPDSPDFSLVHEFAQQPNYVSSVRFMNFEGQPEFGDVTNRYEQVTLFRCHKYFISSEANFLRSRCKLGDNRTFLVLYANGKSAVRVDAPGVQQLGPHFFTGHPSPRWKTPSNPSGAWRDVISNTSILLHYGYSYLSDVTSKAKRSCPGDEFEDAVGSNRSQLGKCFLIDFDRDAYIAAVLDEEEDFFYSRQVLSEGVRIKCKHNEVIGWCVVRDVEYFKYLLIKSGMLKRVREPQQILRMHERILHLKSQEQDQMVDSKTELVLEPKGVTTVDM
eukprot:g7723.t1